MRSASASPNVAVRSAERIVVERRHRSQIAGGYRGFSRPERKVTGQLRPERGLEREIFASDQHARIREEAACQRDMIVQFLQTHGPASPESAMSAMICSEK